MGSVGPSSGREEQSPWYVYPLLMNSFLFSDLPRNEAPPAYTESYIQAPAHTDEGDSKIQQILQEA